MKLRIITFFTTQNYFLLLPVIRKYHISSKVLLFFTKQFDYFNSLLINTIDEDGNFIELGGEFPLEENEHFNKLSVNTLMSDIQVPTNVYNKGNMLLR